MAGTAEVVGLPEIPMQELVAELLRRLGEDPTRPGLRNTPKRVEQSLQWLTRGYRADPRAALGDAIFEEDHHHMVLVKDIEMYSLCEHHLLPFFGTAAVAYIPRGRVIGLSKIPRIVEMYSRRLQVQERMTTQIAGTISELLNPLGVAVVLEAEHLCMRMRGVEKQNSIVVTSAMHGSFRDRRETRDEFMNLIARR